MKNLIPFILLITLALIIGYNPKLYYEGGYWILAYGKGKKRKYKQLNF